MILKFTNFLMFPLLTLGLALPALGDSLNAKQVAATAKWVAHVDFDAGRTTAVGKDIREKALAREHTKERLEKLKAELGFTPETDLHGATLYGDKLVPGSGVLLLSAKVDHEKVTAHLTAKKNVTTSKHGDYILYSWVEPPHRRPGAAAKDGDHKGPPSEEHLHDGPVPGLGAGPRMPAPWDMPHPVTVCIDQKDAVVVASKVETVKAALDVLDGKAGAIASDSPLVAAPADGTVIMIRAADLAGTEMLFKNAVAKQTKELKIETGEASGQSFVHGQLVAMSEDAAKQIEAVLNGLKALGQLRHMNDSNLLATLGKVSISRDGSTVTMEFQAPAEEVVKLVDAARARAKENADSVRAQRLKNLKVLGERLKARRGAGESEK